MARLSPKELQEARRRKAEERQQAKANEEARLLEREQQERQRMNQEAELKERYNQLSNYVNGIYEEANKLSSKRPNDFVSERMVERANRAIRSTRELLVDENDPYLDEIEEFVPAGDEIEVRDVVLTLRQVKDALERMRMRHAKSWSHIY